MPAGDLVVKPVQYEYMSVLMGTGSGIVVQECNGLDSLPDLRTNDQDRTDDHGSVPGLDLMGARHIDMSVAVDDDSHIDVTASMRTLARAMLPRNSNVPFIFMRPGEVKKQCFVRPRRRSFSSNSDMAAGLAKGDMAWVAHDPRIYSVAVTQAVIPLAAGEAAASVEVDYAGDFRTAPLFVIDGQGSDPRIAVSGQDEDVDGFSYNGRTTAFDLILAAGQQMVIDSKVKTATVDGVDAFGTRRNDNQWWQLMPGPNVINFSRSNPVGAQTLTVSWLTAWL